MTLPENGNNTLTIANRFIINNLKTDLIGEGGMGQVYRGYDNQNNQPVAIKQLKSALLTQDKVAIESFKHEGNVLRQLNHPNIVYLLDMVETDEQYYLIMEYVSGGSLKALLNQQKPLTYTHLLKIALELADALSRTHHLNIIHRDLKPGNILLAPDGTPRLADFGIAQLETAPTLNPLTQSGAIVGTIDYLSPETIEGETVDRRTDIWAFGIVLYQMLTNHLPFKQKSVMETLHAILTHPTPDPTQHRPDAPDGLIDLIYRMLTKNPQQRIPSVRLIGAELEQLLQNQTKTHFTKNISALAQKEQRPWLETSKQTALEKHNLPIQTTPFVGRQEELETLNNQLKQTNSRLITIVGPGGMGKTRLVQELGTTQLSHFIDGVYFVSLTPLHNPTAIVPAIAEAIKLPLYKDIDLEKRLLSYLRSKNILLLIDNFEHLLDGVAIVTKILETAPHLKIIATSRERLKLPAEHLFPLQGLDFATWVPSSIHLSNLDLNQSYPAVQLFVNSATQVNPHFKLSEDDLPHLIKICQLVQGMPLALLLAASWAELLTVTEIATELAQSLDFLESDWAAVPARHQSIKTIFEHSWQRLSQSEQHIFQQLSIFQGGFNREAVQAITGASLRDLMALVNKSFLHRLPSGRYHIHELMRQYAAEKLAQSPTQSHLVHEQHSAYYLNLVKKQTPHLKGAEAQSVWAKLRAEDENIHLAWHWAVEQEHSNALLRAIDGLWHFYNRWGREREIATMFKMAHERLYSPPLNLNTASADQLQLLANLLQKQSSYGEESLEHRKELCQQSLTLLTHPTLKACDTHFEKAKGLELMAFFIRHNNPEKAIEYLKESLQLFKEIKAVWETGQILKGLGRVSAMIGNHEQAKHYFTKSLTIFQQLGDKLFLGFVFGDLGDLVAQEGNLAETERLFEEGFRLLQEADCEYYLVAHYDFFGELLFIYFGQFNKAEALFEQSITLFQNLGSEDIFMPIANMSDVKLHQGHAQQAYQYAQQALSLAQASDNNLYIGTAFCLQGQIKLVEQDYEQAKTNFLTALEHIGDYNDTSKILSLAWLAYLAYKQGNTDEGQNYLQQALQAIKTLKRDLLALIMSLTATALILAKQGQVEKAVELYELALQKPLVAKSQWFQAVVGEPLAKLSASLPPNIILAAKQRGQNRDLYTTLDELASEVHT